jgi:hypothetical protein
MKIQEVITQIAQKHNLDLEQPNACLQLTLGGEDWLEISISERHELMVVRYRPAAYQTLAADPGVVFWSGEENWTPLEIIQSMNTEDLPPPGDCIPTSPPYTSFTCTDDITTFLNEWAEILAHHWLRYGQVTQKQREE